MSDRSLTELANRHASDKGTVGPSPSWPVHNYTDVYEAYLRRLRRDPLTILEIGLGVTGERWHAAIVHGRNTGGASLRMWHDYFPKARIHGIDVNACPELDNERITTHVADQGRVEDLEAVVSRVGDAGFDLIFDDGSHRPDHQQVSLGFLFQHLRPGGLYFIEDLMANGHGDTGSSGRSHSDAAISTRSLLRHFAEHGEFPTPHALGDAASLAGQIETIAFHVPRVKLGISLRASVRRPLAPSLAYETGAEKLVVLRKRR